MNATRFLFFVLISHAVFRHDFDRINFVFRGSLYIHIYVGMEGDCIFDDFEVDTEV